MSKSFLEIYGNEASNKINEMDSPKMSLQGMELAKIKSHNSNERILASIAMSSYMQDLLFGRDTIDILVLYDKNMILY